MTEVGVRGLRGAPDRREANLRMVVVRRLGTEPMKTPRQGRSARANGASCRPSSAAGWWRRRSGSSGKATISETCASWTATGCVIGCRWCCSWHISPPCGGGNRPIDPCCPPRPRPWRSGSLSFRISMYYAIAVGRSALLRLRGGYENRSAPRCARRLMAGGVEPVVLNPGDVMGPQSLTAGGGCCMDEICSPDCSAPAWSLFYA